MIKLPQPKLLDFTKIKSCDDVKIIIENTLHKFSPNADYSGGEVRKQPVFGSKVYINNKLFEKLTYGLPFIKFAQNTEPKITYVNKTKFTFNIHYHGLNTVGSIDGTSMEVVFGESTLLGPEVVFKFPKITNNQALLWFHNHNMFISMELIYSGSVGLLQIVDKETKWLEERFEYKNNHIMMLALDIDFDEKGVQTNQNLPVDQNRSSFTVINGVSSINWYSTSKSTSKSKSNEPYVNMMYHKTNDKIVKIDILNATLNWRVYHIGVCDIKSNIKSFYLIQTDGGLINPIKLDMTFIPVAGRISILVDLNDFIDNIAQVFFYDYDLTEIFDSSQLVPDDKNNPLLLATIPNYEKKNQTPYPTPIPDSNQQNQQNQQDNPSNLNYPKINQIEQVEGILEFGLIEKPIKKNIKPFLNIIYKSNFDFNLFNLIKPKQNLEEIICQVKKTVFGTNFYKYNKIIKKPYFEYDGIVNYTKLLNDKYFYNLPKIDLNVPERNFLLFPEPNTNSIASGNPNGVTEYIDGANRIMVDLWNSNELDLQYAINQYNLNPNNFKPPVLPSSKFKIYKTNDKYSNTAMISNDNISIEFFNQKITYGDKTTSPVYTVKVIFPETNFLNIQEWIDLINNTFENTNISDFDTYTKLSDILHCDWSFFPYQYNYMYDKNICLKSAIIKTQNNSQYYIRILGRWPILQFFGKSLTAGTIDNNIQKNNVQKTKFYRSNLDNYNTKNKYHSNIIKNNHQYIKCDEYGIYGIYDADIQAFFPQYATTDGDVQLPIACMKRNGELIINENTTFLGFYDGYLNDNLNSFSVKVKSSELWIYNNGDNADHHPIHFHLTSGYAIPQLNYNSPKLLSKSNNNNPLIYSRDIYQIGPQETIGFYLTWPNYPSDQKTSSPNISGVGGVIHCHFLAHNDSQSMIIQYYVDN